MCIAGIPTGAVIRRDITQGIVHLIIRRTRRTHLADGRPTRRRAADLHIHREAVHQHHHQEEGVRPCRRQVEENHLRHQPAEDHLRVEIHLPDRQEAVVEAVHLVRLPEVGERREVRERPEEPSRRRSRGRLRLRPCRGKRTCAVTVQPAEGNKMRLRQRLRTALRACAAIRASAIRRGPRLQHPKLRRRPHRRRVLPRRHGNDDAN